MIVKKNYEEHYIDGSPEKDESIALPLVEDKCTMTTPKPGTYLGLSVSSYGDSGTRECQYPPNYGIGDVHVASGFLQAFSVGTISISFAASVEALRLSRSAAASSSLELDLELVFS